MGGPATMHMARNLLVNVVRNLDPSARPLCLVRAKRPGCSWNVTERAAVFIPRAGVIGHAGQQRGSGEQSD